MRRRNLVAEVLGEFCICGGLLASRGEVMAYLAECGVKWPLSDRLAWMYPAASAEDAEFLRERGMTLKAVIQED